MQKFTLTMLLLFFSLITLKAQTDSVAATEDKDEGKLTFGGYIDSYYLHAFNRPASGNLMGVAANGLYANNNPQGSGTAPLGGAGRAFDRLTDQFALGLVQFKAMYSNKKSDMVIDLTFGPNAELGQFGNQRAIAPPNTGPQGNAFSTYAAGYYPANGNQSMLYNTSAAIKQAYWTYKATSKLSFTAGQWGTHVGYEVIDAPVNYNYSLSNCFNNGPFYHVGAKANYAFSDKVALMVGLVNNWDDLTAWTKQKDGVAQLFINPVHKWNIYLNWIGGHDDDGFKSQYGTVIAGSSAFAPNQSTGNFVSNNLSYANIFGTTNYNRNLFDLTTGWQVTSKLYFGLNAAWGEYNISTSGAGTTDSTSAQLHSYLVKTFGSTHPDWGGIALYSNYQITDWLGIGGRFEHFDDRHQVRYICAVNDALTVTAPITLASGHFIMKPEFRFDYSPTAYNGVYYYEGANGQSRKTQTTLGVAFIYKY